jgi:hypothetical protein
MGHESQRPLLVLMRGRKTESCLGAVKCAHVFVYKTETVLARTARTHLKNTFVPKQCSIVLDPVFPAPATTLHSWRYFRISRWHGSFGVFASHSSLQYCSTFDALLAFFHSCHVHFSVLTPCCKEQLSNLDSGGTSRKLTTPPVTHTGNMPH